MHYSIWEWILFFFIYSFIGWIWESGYASVKQKRFVNRGFLHGPVIPIYGVGALSILLCTIDVVNSPLLVFVFGMVGATALEYVTGWGMEKIFHVKYWDYSSFKYNLNGYICLPASLAWGAFSVILVEWVNVPIADAVSSMSRNVIEPMVMILMAAGSVDFYKSVLEAMDLRDLLQKLSESKEYIARMQRRMEIASVVKLEDYKSRLAEAEKENLGRRERFIARLHAYRDLRRRQLEELRLKAEELISSKKLAETDIKELNEAIYRQILALGARSDKRYQRIAKHLRRNPGANSKKYLDAMNEIKDIMD